MGRWPGSQVLEANKYLWGNARSATASLTQAATLPGTGPHQTPHGFWWGAARVSPRYPHSLAAHPSYGPTEPGPGTTHPGIGTWPRPPRSLAPPTQPAQSHDNAPSGVVGLVGLLTPPTHVTMVGPAHLPPLLPSHTFLLHTSPTSPTPTLGSQTPGSGSLAEHCRPALCPLPQGHRQCGQSSHWGSCPSRTGVSTPYLSPSIPGMQTG